MQRQINPSLQGHFSEQPRVQTLFYFENKKKDKKKALTKDHFFQIPRAKKYFYCAFSKLNDKLFSDQSINDI
jgi:hypothetical protein